MTYAFVQDVPIDETTYARVTDGLGDDPPPGLLAHLTIARPEGGLRYVDVWATEADFERFAEERLHPVVHALLAEVFGDDLPPEPPRDPLRVIHVWTPAPTS